MDSEDHDLGTGLERVRSLRWWQK